MNIFNLFSTFLLTSLSLLVLKPVATRIGLIDHPGGRKTHSAPTPLIGGLGIYLGTLFISFFSPDILEHYGALLAISALVLAIGVLDDLKDISASTRMGTQAAAALLMCVLAGNQINGFGNLLGFGTVELGLFAIPLTVFAAVGVINAVNMSDGIDGLSGGTLVIALSFLGVMAFEGGDFELLAFIAILVFSILGFLALNYRLPWKRPAMIYLGDAGSTFLGFVLAWLLIEATQGPAAVMPPVLALWFLSVPLIDTVYLLISRPLNGRSSFSPGRDHLHHKLLEKGLSTDKTVSFLYAANIIIGTAGLAAWRAGMSESQLFYAFVALFVLYALLSSKRPATARTRG